MSFVDVVPLIRETGTAEHAPLAARPQSGNKGHNILLCFQTPSTIIPFRAYGRKFNLLGKKICLETDNSNWCNLVKM